MLKLILVSCSLWLIRLNSKFLQFKSQKFSLGQRVNFNMVPSWLCKHLDLTSECPLALRCFRQCWETPFLSLTSECLILYSEELGSVLSLCSVSRSLIDASRSSRLGQSLDSQALLGAPVGLPARAWGGCPSRRDVCFRYLSSVARSLYWHRLCLFQVDPRQLNWRAAVMNNVSLGRSAGFFEAVCHF